MPVFMRPEAEIYYEVHGSGFPLLLFAAGGLRSQLAYWRHSPSNPDAAPPWILQPGTDTPHPAATSDEIARLAPNLEIQKDWRGPTHLAESIRRVTDFLTRHTPR